MTVAVETKSLWKTYPGDIHAVRGVDIRIEPGELMVLVGPSGCGKTTTLRMIAGLERVTSADILVGDRIVNRVHPSKRGVALVFQNFALYPHKSAWENMAFPLESAGVAKAEINTRIAEVAEMLELTQHLGKRPSELSGGQQQRVSLGRAVVRNPDVLLLDEPLSNLDARLRVVMRTELKRIHRAVGSTAIYVTHDQVEAMTMGDRIVVMHAGEVAQIGTPQEVYLTPSCIPVARTIGSPAMNLVTGAPLVSDGAVDIQGDGWRLSITDEAANHLAQSLNGAKGHQVVVGVRPEDLDFHTASPGNADTLARDHAHLGRGQCQTAEPLGSETLYNLQFDSDLLRIMRRENHVSLKEGASADVFITPGARVHIFDKATGMRLAGIALQDDDNQRRWAPFTHAGRLESDRSL